MQTLFTAEKKRVETLQAQTPCAALERLRAAQRARNSDVATEEATAFVITIADAAVEALTVLAENALTQAPMALPAAEVRLRADAGARPRTKKGGGLLTEVRELVLLTQEAEELESGAPNTAAPPDPVRRLRKSPLFTTWGDSADDHARLDALVQRADVAYEHGRYAIAVVLWRRVWFLRDRTLGSEHLGTLTSLHNVAACLNNQGRYDDAEALLRELIPQRETALGK